MKPNRLSSQRGISFLGLIFWGVVLCGLGIVIAEAAPTYIEYQAVLKACNRAKEGTSVQEVKSLFEKQAEIDRIKSISANDLDIGKGPGDKVVIRFEYQNEIHLFGPAYLTLKYRGETK